MFPSKYRRKVLTEPVEETLKQVCIGISERYELRFLEIGSDEDHVHFLVQSVPNMSITGIVTIIKKYHSSRNFQESSRGEEITLGW